MSPFTRDAVLLNQECVSLRKPVERDLVLLLMLLCGYAVIMGAIFFVTWSWFLNVTRNL